MKDFISKATFGFVMAQLFPGAIAVFAITATYFFLESPRPEGLRATASVVLQTWSAASLGHQLFLFGLCVGVGMFIHGLHWASLGSLETRRESVFDSPWHKHRLIWQVLLAPFQLLVETGELFILTKGIRGASIRENVPNMHKDHMPHFEFIQDFYLYSAQFFAHTAYSLFLVWTGILTYAAIYGLSLKRFAVLVFSYLLVGVFFVLGRIQLRTMFLAETDLANRSPWARTLARAESESIQ